MLTKNLRGFRRILGENSLFPVNFMVDFFVDWRNKKLAISHNFDVTMYAE